MGRFARGVDEASIEPSLVLQGSQPQILSGRNGRLLDRAAAEKAFVQALTGLSRKPVPIPLKVERTRLSTKDLVGAKVKAETALSAPVDVAYGPGGWHLSVAKIARVLQLPSDGDTELQLAGPRADRFFANLKKRIEHAPRDATFAIGGRNIVRVRPRPARAHAEHGGHHAQPDGRAPVADQPQGRPRRHDRPARADDRRRAHDGHHRARRRVRDVLRRRPEPDPQRPARRAPDRQPLHRPNEEFSFNATTGERSSRRASSKRR
jgi:hypothetical protein